MDEEPEIIGNLEPGTEFYIVARYWPGGLHLRTKTEPAQTGLGVFHKQAEYNLAGPTYHLVATDLDADDDEEEDVYLLVGQMKANVSFGREAARNGAFNPVLHKAFDFDVDEE